MGLQYLTNATPPPVESVLQYDVEPGIVYVSTATESMYADLTITVYNPTSAPINCMEFQLGFLADTDADALATADDVTNIAPTSDQNTWQLNSSGWNVSNPNLYLYNFEPSGISEYLPLAANASLVFRLNQVKIAVGEGIAPFTIIETTGTSKNDKQIVKGSIGINKTTGTLSINSFVVNPPEPITPGIPIVLSWQLTGADRWEVYDVEAAVILYDSQSPTEPNLTSWPVPPQLLKPLGNTFYVLIARAGQLFNFRVAAAMVTAAHFLADPTAQPPTINPGGTATLHWATRWASQLVISAPGFTTVTLNAPPGQYDIFPAAPGNQYQVTPSYSMPYTLEISGPGNSQDTKQVTVSVNLPPPTITSFEISPQPPVANTGQNLSLSWQSQYGYVATLGQIIRGTDKVVNLQYVPLNSNGFAVTPTAISDFILTINGDKTTTAQLTGIENAGTIPVGNSPSALLFDGTYIWVANTNDSTITKIEASTGTVVGTYNIGSMPTDLAYDGTYIWVVGEFDKNWTVSNTVIRLNASDGSMAGNFTVGNGPIALAFDGTYIYVANYLDSTVMKLSTQDGSVLHTYNVGNGPQEMLFDGANIWVANWHDDTVNKLRLSDDTVLGPYAVGTSPVAFAFDGANVWVANQNSNNLTKLRASDGTVLGTYSLGSTNPTLTAAAFDGVNVWIAGTYNDVGNWLYVLRPADGSLLFAPITLDNPPAELAFDGSYMWVALSNTGNGTVLKL